MAAKFTSIANLNIGIAAEATALATAIEAVLNTIAPFVSLGAGALKFDEICQQVARLRALGLDADDPLPGRVE